MLTVKPNDLAAVVATLVCRHNTDRHRLLAHSQGLTLTFWTICQSASVGYVFKTNDNKMLIFSLVQVKIYISHTQGPTRSNFLLWWKGKKADLWTIHPVSNFPFTSIMSRWERCVCTYVDTRCGQWEWGRHRRTSNTAQPYTWHSDLTTSYML